MEMEMGWGWGYQSTLFLDAVMRHFFYMVFAIESIGF